MISFREKFDRAVHFVKELHYDPAGSCSVSCKIENEKYLFSTLNTMISCEQVVIFLLAGFILGYAMGKLSSNRVIERGRRRYERLHEHQQRLEIPPSVPRVPNALVNTSIPSSRSQIRRIRPSYTTDLHVQTVPRSDFQNNNVRISQEIMRPSAPPMSPVQSAWDPNCYPDLNY